MGQGSSVCINSKPSVRSFSQHERVYLRVYLNSKVSVRGRLNGNFTWQKIDDKNLKFKIKNDW